ncbi:MAG: hypothetical protein RL632_871 [Bacteroidota bacterium]|jgi:hypothetical protein
MKLKSLLLGALLVLSIQGAQAQDTIKFMTYNILNYPDVNTARIAYLKTIVQHIKPDVFLVNEITQPVGATNIISQALNQNGITYYAQSQYVQSPDDENMLFYNTQKLGLVQQNTISTSLRDFNEYILYYKEPGMTAQSDTVYFYVYAAHLKAGNTASDIAQRGSETAVLKSYLSTRANAENTVVAGDMNIYNNSEAAYINFTGTTQANLYDVVGSGIWHSNSFYKMHFTQSTRIVAIDGGSTGGMDDRFDMILFSDDMQTGTNGAKYVPGTYRAVGQDGLRLNSSLIDPVNNSEPTNVINALYYMSDHLPVYMEVAVGGNLGVDQVKMSPLKVYPVPASDLLYVKIDAAVKSMHLIDLSGRRLTLSPETSGNVMKIDVSMVAAGTYMLQVETSTGSYTERIIIE